MGDRSPLAPCTFAGVSLIVANALSDHLPVEGVSWILVERPLALHIVLRHRQRRFALGLAAGLPVGLSYALRPVLPLGIWVTVSAARLPLWLHAAWHRMLGRQVRRG